MPYCNGALIAARSSLIVVGVVLLSLSMAIMDNSNARALVEVMICPDASQSRFTLTAPQSDSIVNDPQISVSGEVQYISQIDFMIDDVYNNTLALGYSATNFTSQLTLPPGTHTITFIATDSCSQSTHNGSLVVTYEPRTQPSVGEDVETVVDGVVTSAKEVSQPEPEKNIIEKAMDSYVVPPLRAAGDSLDITAPPEDPAQVIEGTDVARAALFVAGAVLTVSAVYIGAMTLLPVNLSFLMKFRRRKTTIAAIIGLVLMGLTFIL